MATQKLELTWVNKDKNQPIETRLLIKNDKLGHSNITNLLSSGTEGNMIIHGDNLLALEALSKTHSGMVDFIYIDPPYNTGKAFDEYDDNLEHSIWLNLMYRRMILLKKLLKETGVICCHIDDSGLII